ncbi:benzoylformate decarboxylase [Ktedonosporobacter rubrisoli]|uniref:Benzoylformate decarboxylase n=1 Tax=Ktedonosporobacter rubrisoli TaxID=2509675 RepID=A0A4P6JN39_KTERU|nr:benzoylformate decarboxylase [Ktedonosporobacter rubrisoli]QBD76674.1 benzoylformate decarboxylase [Ktedonosporobacter rubrisoli]
MSLPSKPPYTVRDATLALLRSFGMTTIFGNPGSTELPLFKHWPADFRYILALQESSVVAMADGYAHATRNAAFVNLHSAIGLGHGLGSVFSAYRNQTPLVITAGQQTRAMLLTEPYLWASDAPEFPRPYVKWSCEPARAQDVPAAIARAYYLAMQKPCGPTFVSIPADDWEREAEPVTPRQVSTEFAPDPLALQHVADALNRSQHPALIVGPSVDRDGAWDAVVTLAERTRAAVWASPMSHRASFPEDHQLFVGFLPPVRQLIEQKLADYDVVVVLGAPIFTYHVHTEGPFAPEGVEVFQLIDDPQAASWSVVGSSLLTTLKLGVEQLLELVMSSARPAPQARHLAVPPATHPMSGEFVMHTVSQIMPQDAIIVEEAPSHRNALHDYLPIRKPDSFYTAASGGLGYSLPASVGIALANPGRHIICLLGDGSSMYSVQALWTAAQHQLPISFVIFNNQEYAALKSFSKMLDTPGLPGVDLPGIDFESIARGYGCMACRVEKAEELAEALTDSFKRKGPVLLNVLVDPAVPQLY